MYNKTVCTRLPKTAYGFFPPPNEHTFLYKVCMIFNQRWNYNCSQAYREQEKFVHICVRDVCGKDFCLSASHCSLNGEETDCLCAHATKCTG